MRTSEEIFHRIRWDPRLDPSRFVMGVALRGGGITRVPLAGFVAGGDIPWHRVRFIEADGETVWDRESAVDRLDSTVAGRVVVPRLLREPAFTPRRPHAWSPTSGWRPAGETRPSSATALRVLTWNTLWDRYDGDRIDTRRRHPLLLAALAAADADVIALQEVEAGLITALLDAPWVRADYQLGADPTSRDIAAHGLLLLSRLPVLEAGIRPLGPHKGVAAITVTCSGGPVVVATTHLTSDHSTDGPRHRRRELAEIADVLSTVDSEVIVVGDFNDGTRVPAEALALRDAWTHAQGERDDSPTFDPTTNPLAAVSSLTGRAGRLDRVLVRGARLRVVDARLHGDAPATDDGLFISDHYGVSADLDASRNSVNAMGADAMDADTVDVDATPRTAVAWLPPDELWPAIDEIRAAHDPQVDRWPPHVNLIFGFVPECDFDRAVPLLAAAAAAVSPFTAKFGDVGHFTHRDTTTLWLDPAAAEATAWRRLRAALTRPFPRCLGRAEGFTPHLTVARVTGARGSGPRDLRSSIAARLSAAGLSSTEAPVSEVAVLSRRGDGPMRPRAVIHLGTGAVRWLPALAHSTEAPAAARLAAKVRHDVRDALSGLAGTVVHTVGSRRMDCALPEADLDLVVVLPDDQTVAWARERIVAGLPEATRIRAVKGARVPGLRLDVADLRVDIMLVDAAPLSPALAVDQRMSLAGTAAMTLSAVSDADAILAASAPHQETFRRLARLVKRWARARGLDSAPFGGVPGVGWAVLAARTVRDRVGTCERVDDGVLVRHFFGDWAAWDWRTPVTLTGEIDAMPTDSAPMRVLTPTAPVRSCTAQVSVEGLDVITDELYRAWEIAEARPDDPWPQLVAPPESHRLHRAWAVVTVRADDPVNLANSVGAVRGRILALLADLGRGGATGLRAWPRPIESGPRLARFAIGLGRTPPDRVGLADLTGPWLADLGGVELSWHACGEVPTLR